MTKAVESGMPKLRIEEAAARRQARSTAARRRSSASTSTSSSDESHMEVRDIDNTEVRRQQLVRLERVKAKRDPDRVRAALDALTAGAKSDANLLELSIEASRAGDGGGDLRRDGEGVRPASGRDPLDLGCVRGRVRRRRGVRPIRKEVDEFAAEEGRRPRILVAKLGQDGHDRGAKVIATAFADLGFDVDIGPLFQTPDEAARDAIENDVHVVGISSQAAGHKTLVPQLIEALRSQGAKDVIVVVGGVIPANDYEFLFDAGVSAIFGPGSNICRAASEILTLVRERRGHS